MFFYKIIFWPILKKLSQKNEKKIFFIFAQRTFQHMLKRKRILGKRRNQWVQEASQCQCKKIVFTQKMAIQGPHLRTDTNIFTRIFQPRQRSILEYIYSKYQFCPRQPYIQDKSEICISFKHGFDPYPLLDIFQRNCIPYRSHSYKNVFSQRYISW